MATVARLGTAVMVAPGVRVNPRRSLRLLAVMAVTVEAGARAVMAEMGVLVELQMFKWAQVLAATAVMAERVRLVAAVTVAPAV